MTDSNLEAAKVAAAGKIAVWRGRADACDARNPGDGELANMLCWYQYGIAESALAEIEVIDVDD
jgi:hypothetical protein